ncbi:3-hydroxyacyl-CoA dehydrogenase family protein [Candidatus Dojkabacteria bacterium]|nr:3-hydroxyacyl-CoA dehydrogenase family protein [Candidatus Dojkabacteria bacterium]
MRVHRYRKYYLINLKINKVVVFGANGNVGAQCAAIIAGFGGAQIYMLSRSKEKSRQGISKACQSIRSDVIKSQMIPGSYNKDLKKALQEADWVLETVSENYSTKRKINEMISSVPKRDRIISTVTSGLSINELSKSLSKEDQKKYFGTHFFNPPYKMLLCELIPNQNSNKKVLTFLREYLEKTLHRRVIIVKDSPAFVANRIGFQFLNEAALFAQKYKDKNGVSYIDYILGSFTGRSMTPLNTINYVGLDVHQAIVDNIYMNSTDDLRNLFKTPEFINDLIKDTSLGLKSGQGIYKYDKDHGFLPYSIKNKDYEKAPNYDFQIVYQMKDSIRYGLYKEAFRQLLKANDPVANDIKHFIARYISYSFSLVGNTVKNYKDIDIAMSYGFGWAPPSSYIELLGGLKETTSLIQNMGMMIPELIKTRRTHLESEIDFRPFFRK